MSTKLEIERYYKQHQITAGIDGNAYEKGWSVFCEVTDDEGQQVKMFNEYDQTKRGALKTRTDLIKKAIALINQGKQ